MIEQTLKECGLKERITNNRVKIYADDENMKIATLSKDVLIIYKYKDPSDNMNRSSYGAHASMMIPEKYIVDIRVKEFLREG